MAASRPAWLMDVGSTVLKLSRTTPSGGFGPTVREPRRPGLSPGEQAVRLLRESGFDPSSDALRACSSAGSGPTVGILGMTGRYSIAAAAQAAVTAGAQVSYTRRLDTPVGAPLLPVDVLVVVGGVDGTDHARLDRAVRGTRLAEHPHRALVWAGAGDAAVAALLRPRHRAENVVDGELRPNRAPLAETLRRIHLADIVDREGLRPLEEYAGAPVPATPEVVGGAARALAGEQDGAAGVLVVDVGGTTTDVHHCARPAGGVDTRVFTGLGVAGARRSLLDRLASTPALAEFVGAVAPGERRVRYLRLREGDSTALPPRDAVLACVFLALSGLDEEHRTGPARLVVTGGAADGLDPVLLAAVAEAARGGPQSRPPVVDTAPGLWARGLLALSPTPA